MGNYNEIQSNKDEHKCVLFSKDTVE